MIPRHLHVIWVGPPMPTDLAANLTEWRRLHPAWDVTVWGDDDLAWLQHRDLYDQADRLVPRDAVGQFRSDIARYEILRRHGGLYVDCDTHPLRPVDDALDGLDAFAAAENRRFVGNTYLGCTPGHPVMAELVDRTRASIAANRGRRPNWMTGPRFLTPIWLRHGCHVAPTEQWFPITYQQARSGRRVPATFPPDVYAAHEWRHVRQARRRAPTMSM